MGSTWWTWCVEDVELLGAPRSRDHPSARVRLGPASTLRTMSEQRSDDDLAALQAEVDRLRQLVGPTEQSYFDLRQDLLAARDAAKGAEAAEGVYRGRVNELEVALARARQDQDHFQRAVFDTLRNLRLRVGRALRSRLL
jgi:hypothetical protein